MCQYLFVFLLDMLVAYQETEVNKSGFVISRMLVRSLGKAFWGYLRRGELY